MRPLFVLLIWVVLLGGLGAYQAARKAFIKPRQNAVPIQRAPGLYSVEITPTFDAQGGVDDFALELVAQPSIILSLNGTEIARHEEIAQAAIPLSFHWDIAAVPLEIEKNEFGVRISTPEGDASAVHGARFRLVRDGTIVTDQTIWSDPGTPLDGVVRVVIEQPLTPPEETHSHAE